MNTNHIEHIAGTLKLKPAQVAATIELFDAGNTIPFVARYRKERTGGVDEEQLRLIHSLMEDLRALDERRQTISAAIEAQGKLTPELQRQLAEAATRTALEDLYQPYKQKRRTRAGMARDKGLQPLADLILAQVRGRETAEQLAAPYLTAEVPMVEDAYAGARDIVAEAISRSP